MGTVVCRAVDKKLAKDKELKFKNYFDN